MKIEQILKNYNISKLDKITVSIYNNDFSFMYTIADAVCKEEFKGKYRYFGGLQCNYEEDSTTYKELEKELCIIAERALNVTSPSSPQQPHQ